MRDKLQAKGYPMERFGWQYRYFYTLLCRLDENGKIERINDEVMLKG
nr:hypothetical protein [Nitrosomonas nitrosa]